MPTVSDRLLMFHRMLSSQRFQEQAPPPESGRAHPRWQVLLQSATTSRTGAGSQPKSAQVRAIPGRVTKCPMRAIPGKVKKGLTRAILSRIKKDSTSFGYVASS